MLYPSPHLLWFFACLFGMLAFLLSVASLLGNIGILFLLGVAGILSLKEFIQILGWKSVGGPSICVVFAIVTIYYSVLAFGYAEQVRAMAPVAILICLGAVRAWLGLIDGFIRVTAAMIWGAMLLVYCLSHAYFVMKFCLVYVASQYWC